MRRHQVPEKTSTEMHTAIRNIQDDIEDSAVPRVYDRKTLQSLQEGKSVRMKEGNCLCVYTRFGGKLYKTTYEPVD